MGPGEQKPRGFLLTMTTQALRRNTAAQALQHYRRIRFPRGRHYNQTKTRIRSLLGDTRPFVPRDRTLWMANNHPILAAAPTLDDFILGEDFILACYCLDLDWEKYRWSVPTLPRHYQRLIPHALPDEDPVDADREFVLHHFADDAPRCRESPLAKTLGDIWFAAIEQCANWNFEFRGIFDPETGIERPARIGDYVQSFRKSSTDLSLLYDEPTEERITLGLSRDDSGRYHSTCTDPGRADGDIRWTAMADSQYETIWEGGRWFHRSNCPVDPDGLYVNNEWVWVPLSLL